MTREEAWRPIATVPGMWSVNGYGQFMVEEKATGRRRAGSGRGSRRAGRISEIGWSIFPEHWGKGYAAEGAAATLIWRTQRSAATMSST